MLITKTQQDPVEWSSSFIVREDKATYTKHDLLFKRLIETFFTEFMEAFFPNLYEKIDFKALKFLSEEMVPVVHDKNDWSVVEVSWRKTDSTIVIHVEPQGYYQSDFHERMFHYFSLLYRKVEKTILPITLFSYDENWDKDEFTMAIGQMEVLKFNYLTLHFRKMDWRNFILQKIQFQPLY